MTGSVRINRDRLWASLMELKEIRAYDDEAIDVPANAGLRLADQP